jgi:GTP cyclohydrolase II
LLIPRLADWRVGFSTVSQNSSDARVERVADASLPCAYGNFRVLGYRGTQGSRTQELIVLQFGDLSQDGPAPLVRIHSQCLTGEVFGSQRCDCGPQLQMAMRLISEEGRGILIYDPQEGRGIGILNKLRAYELQDQGADTVEANEALGFAADERDYGLAVAVLLDLGAKRVRFLSNNPAKVAALETAGVAVDERVPCEPTSSDRAVAYLKTKKKKLGHLIETL